MELVQSGFIRPVVSPIINIGADRLVTHFRTIANLPAPGIMAVAAGDSVGEKEEAESKGKAKEKERDNDSMAKFKLHELKQKAEHLARIRPLVTSANDDVAFHDTKSSVSKKDSQLSFTAKRAEDIISIAKDYAAFAAKYPRSAYMLETALLPTISVSAKAIAGAVVGGPAGAAGGAMAGICAEVQAIVVHEVAGERIAEVVDSAIGRASSLWASFDPTLTEDQARALGATAVLGTVFTIEAKAVFKQAIGVTSTLRSGRTTGSSAAKETVHAFDGGKKETHTRAKSVGATTSRISTQFENERFEEYLSKVKAKDKVDPKEVRYEPVEYHHHQSSGIKSKAPTNPQEALENALFVKDSSKSKQFVGVDLVNKEIAVFKYNGNGNIFHAYVEKYANLRPFQQDAVKELAKTNAQIKSLME